MAPEYLTYALIAIILVGIAVGVLLVVLIADRLNAARLADAPAKTPRPKGDRAAAPKAVRTAPADSPTARIAPAQPSPPPPVLDADGGERGSVGAMGSSPAGRALPGRAMTAPEPTAPAAQPAAPAAEPAAEALPQAGARSLDGPIGNPYVDALTGLGTLLAWERALSDEGIRIARYRRPVSIVAMELEGMLRLMKQYGPEPAHRVIPVIADIVSRTSRRTDRVAHVGAGRFLVLLPETDEIQAINFVERVRSICERWLATTDLGMRPVIGWASASGTGELETALRTAEDRMRAERVRGA